jgi:hypothetical protein
LQDSTRESTLLQAIRSVLIKLLPVKTRRSTMLDSHHGTPVRVSGIVRNRVVYLYGVEFLIDRQEDRQQIARLSHSFGGTTRLQSSCPKQQVTVPFARSLGILRDLADSAVNFTTLPA